jgi:hypothetical protein
MHRGPALTASSNAKGQRSAAAAIAGSADAIT